MDVTGTKIREADDLAAVMRQVTVRWAACAVVLVICARGNAQPPRVSVRGVREVPSQTKQLPPPPPRVTIGEIRAISQRWAPIGYSPAEELAPAGQPSYVLPPARNLPWSPSLQRPPVDNPGPTTLHQAAAAPPLDGQPARVASHPDLAASFPPPPAGQPSPSPDADTSRESPEDGGSCPPPFFDPAAFSPDPNYDGLPYEPARELATYTHKWCNPNQRPIVELFRGLYRKGEIPPSWPVITETNPIMKHFLVFGDLRTAVAYNDNGGDDEEIAVWANRLNLDFDLKLTATERLHAFWGPLDDGGQFTRGEFRDDNLDFFLELDDDFDTLFFEGDLGYLWGGLTNQWAPFDLPFVVGKYPLLYQNGTWMLDIIEGFSFAIPAKNNAFFDWSNYDISFFFGFDDVDSPAFGKDDNAADVYGFQWFLDAYDGYVELGYAYLDDRSGQGLSYNNIGLAYTRRYFQRVSNSLRVIINSGQSPNTGQQTADGTLVLLENALITSAPNYFVPYLNLFAGFDRPQSVARAAGVGGILLNTGINFETDFLTGFPTLDATANNTYGGALGVNLLGPDFTWQLIMELATVQVFGDDANRNAAGDQYGFGMRFQVPINFAWLIRFDAMYGLFDDAPDVRGARAELRWKF